MSSAQFPRNLLHNNPLWLAPMAGVNDAAFRALCKEQGAGLTFSEMVSAKGLHYHRENENARRLLQFSESEAPFGVQLFGSDPAIMAEQAAALAAELGDDLACIDINMGCPVAKVVNKGEGAALMREPLKATEIVAAVSEALRPFEKAVTVKFRRGFEEPHETAAEFARALEAAGAAALTVHGRFRSQFYKGASDGGVIARVKEAVTIPVLASGDLFTPLDVAEALLVRGADGAMIARGAQGNPWIFSQSHQLLDALAQSGASPSTTDELAEAAREIRIDEPDLHERFAMMKKHGALLSQYFGEKSLIRMRKHAVWYCAGMPGATHFRTRIQRISSMEDLEALIDEYERYLNDHASH